MVATGIGTHHAELARPNTGRAPSGPAILRSILRDIRHVWLVVLTFGLLSGPTITLGVAPEGDDTSASSVVAAASALPQQEASGVLARQPAVGVRKLRGGEWVVDRRVSFGL